MYGGEAAYTCFLARSCLLTLGRWWLKQSVQGILRNEPVLADFDCRKLAPLDFPSHTIRFDAQALGCFSRGVVFKVAHISITPLLLLYYGKSGI
jgi:hypothetical protein